EILKRQVFLEALQQWEHVRLDEPEAYEVRLDRLNRLFANRLVVRIATRIFAVSPRGSEAPTERQIGDTGVTLLGVDWFKRALERTPGATIEIPASLLDELGGILAEHPSEAGEASTPYERVLDRAEPVATRQPRSGVDGQELAEGVAVEVARPTEKG